MNMHKRINSDKCIAGRYCQQLATLYKIQILGGKTCQSTLVRRYQCVQHRRLDLSTFISAHSKIIRFYQSFLAPSKLISDGLTLSVRKAQSVSFYQIYPVFSVYNKYMSKFFFFFQSVLF